MTKYDDLVNRSREAADALEEWVQKYTGIQATSVESTIIRELVDAIEALTAERDALAAENERLRGVVNALANCDRHPVDLIILARAALEEGKDG
jgi:hypothetical protein